MKAAGPIGLANQSSTLPDPNISPSLSRRAPVDNTHIGPGAGTVATSRAPPLGTTNSIRQPPATTPHSQSNHGSVHGSAHGRSQHGSNHGSVHGGSNHGSGSNHGGYTPPGGFPAAGTHHTPTSDFPPEPSHSLPPPPSRMGRHGLDGTRQGSIPEQDYPTNRARQRDLMYDDRG